jgi:hypothetical protein
MGSDAMVMGCTTGMSGTMSMCPATTVRLASPGATVNRTVQLIATPAAGMGVMVMRVDFMVDGARVGMASSAPYTISWDSTTVSDGTHSLTATVTDSMDMMASSTPVTVQVENNPASRSDGARTVVSRTKLECFRSSEPECQARHRRHGRQGRAARHECDFSNHQ